MNRPCSDCPLKRTKCGITCRHRATKHPATVKHSTPRKSKPVTHAKPVIRIHRKPKPQEPIPIAAQTYPSMILELPPEKPVLLKAGKKVLRLCASAVCVMLPQFIRSVIPALADKSNTQMFLPPSNEIAVRQRENIYEK